MGAISLAKKISTLVFGSALAFMAVYSSSTLAKEKIEVPAELKNKTIKLVVGFPPGGGTDITARSLIPYLHEYSGLNFIVENKPGAGGKVATDKVINNKADPTEWLFVTTGQLITNVLLMDLDEQPLDHLTLVSRSTVAPLVLVVDKDSPYSSFKDIVEASKKTDKGLNYGSAGVGTPQHIGVEWLQSLSGLKATHAPYRGSGPTMMALLAGDVDFVLEAATAASSHVKGGKVKAIGLSKPINSKEYADLPLLSDDYSEFDLVSWTGLALNKEVSQEVQSFAEKVLKQGLTDTEFIQKLKKQGGNPSWESGDEFLKDVEEEYEMTEKLVKERNIKM